MNKKVIFTALALGGAIVFAIRKMTQSKKAAKAGPPKMSKYAGGEFTERGIQAMG